MINKEEFTALLRGEALTLQIKIERIAGSAENLVSKSNKIQEAFDAFKTNIEVSLDNYKDDANVVKLDGKLIDQSTITIDTTEQPTTNIEKINTIEGPTS